MKRAVVCSPWSVVGKAIFFLALGAVFFALCGPVDAQQPKKVPRIGFLSTASLSSLSPRLDAFRQGLRKLGHIEGKNIAIEYRSAEGNTDRLPALAVELLGLKVDCIVTAGTSPTRAARKATSTIPIVMTNPGNPVQSGLVASLARPGGNITGLSSISIDLAGKRLELLKEALPKLSRAAIFSDPRSETGAIKETESAARSLNVELIFLEVRTLVELENAFQSIAKSHADAFIGGGGGFFNTHRLRTIELAAKHRLPGMYTEQEYVLAGGLMAYATSIPDLYRRAATYVDKILKGAKPADLPVEQPTKFELVINLKTAKQIGRTIPPGVLARADKIIR
ncbi:MAG TPA: ABC transporter substrate-binding protein [Candidatus Binatia bacterium]|nr:ABC transporter substrate-binding protein [Candidatus Binatia bacterium]